jgi:nucleotide-binding universal stress UspA family protein
MKHEQPQEPPRGRIVVGTDGSLASAAAVRWAVEAAEQTGAWLDVVLVWSAVIDFGWLGAAPLHGWLAQPASDGHALLDSLVAEVCGGPPPTSLRTFVIEGDPALCLLDHATGADALVLADRGAGGFLGLQLGSVASTCAAHATCPVLIVPAGHGGATPDLFEPLSTPSRYVPTPPARATTGASR